MKIAPLLASSAAHCESQPAKREEQLVTYAGDQRLENITDEAGTQIFITDPGKQVY